MLYDQPTGRLALVFELMNNNIYEMIRGRRHYIAEERVKLLMYQLCKAMDHMHRNGIFHRDIKPENVLVIEELLKVADFGSCRGIYSKQPYTEYISTRWYRAPECLLTDGYYGYKMDMWGVGCVMFEVLALFPLFPGTNEMDQINKIHNVIGTPPPEVLAKFKKYAAHIDFNFPETEGTGIAKLLPHVSSEGVDMIEKLLAYDPEDRISARQAMRHAWFAELRAMEKRQAAAASAASASNGASSTARGRGGSSETSSSRALSYATVPPPPAPGQAKEGKDSESTSTGAGAKTGRSGRHGHGHHGHKGGATGRSGRAGLPQIGGKGGTHKSKHKGGGGASSSLGGSNSSIPTDDGSTYRSVGGSGQVELDASLPPIMKGQNLKFGGGSKYKSSSMAIGHHGSKTKRSDGGHSYGGSHLPNAKGGKSSKYSSMAAGRGYGQITFGSGSVSKYASARSGMPGAKGGAGGAGRGSGVSDAGPVSNKYLSPYSQARAVRA